MIIVIKPPEKKDKKGRKRKVNINFGLASNALEFRLNMITAKSFEKKYTLDLIENSNEEQVEVVVTDGQNKQHKLQYFNSKRNVSCCSCEEFITDECRYCVHLAAVENAVKYPSYYKEGNINFHAWMATFRTKLLKLPKTIKEYKQHYTFFDPYSKNYYTFGKEKPTVETVGTKTFNKINKRILNQKVNYLPKDLDDSNLLDGVTLYQYQKDIFKNMLNAQRAICSMVMGSGKANWIHSKILTPAGWVEMKDIKIGDYVIGSSGKPTKVIGVYPQGEKSIYKVTFTDGSSAFCCDEHLWAIKTPQQKYRGSEYKVKPLNTFMNSLVDKCGNHKYHIPMVKPVEFDPKPIELDPYVLGLLLGDGGLSCEKSVSFSSVDKFIVEYLQTHLPCSNLRLKIKKNSNKDYCITKNLPSNKPNKLLDIIRQLNLNKKKSYYKHIPPEYKYNTPEIRLSLLQGLMDTDGFVNKSGTGVVFYSSSIQLAKDVQEIVWSFGGKAVVRNKQTYYIYNEQKYEGNPSFAVHISLPKEIIPFRLPRKINRFKPRSKYEPVRYFDKVEYIGEKPAQCIAVEAPDHLYITDDYIVTHNTLTTIACYSLIDKNKPGGGASMLVVAPKSLREQWGEEIERTCHVPVFQIEKPTDIEASKNNLVNVVTYQFLTRHIDKFKARKWDIVVVDEIQFVRNSTTKTWKAISKVKSDFFFGLSGTVIENRLDDLYSIMEIISPGILGPKWKFDDNYQELFIKGKAKWLYKGYKNLDQLKETLKDSVFSYDNLKLPPIQYHEIFTNPSQEQKTMHDEYYEEAKRIIAKSLDGHISPQERLLVQSLYLKARQVGNTIELITKKPEKASEKITKFLEIVENVCVKNNEKLVVFSDWVGMLKITARWTKKKFGIEPVYFTGQQNTQQRQEAIKSFQNDPNCKMIFCSNAASTGVDGLQKVSSNLVNLELAWNPAILDQRNARLHRIGQQNPVNIYYLITKNTLEEHIHSLLKEKKNIRIQTLAGFNV